MKTKVTFNKRDKVILLFESQLNLRYLETKVKTAHSINEKYVIIYYQDKQGLNYILVNDDKILNMCLDFLDHFPSKDFRKFITLEVKTMHAFLAQNQPAIVENILKHYFYEKTKPAKTLDLFEKEITSVKDELKRDGVKQELIQKILEFVVFEFLKVFQNPNFQISSNKISEITNLNISDEKEVSSIVVDSFQHLSLFSITHDSAHKQHTEKEIKKTVVYYNENDLCANKNKTEKKSFDLFGFLNWFK